MENDVYVTKRNGSLELINLNKIHKVINWATEGLVEVSVNSINSVYGYCCRLEFSFFQQFYIQITYPEIKFINVKKDSFLKQIANTFILFQRTDIVIKIIFILFFLISRFNTPLYNERIPFYG